jgi:glycosyltransferase involved in cell wall biosynthesis
LGEQNLVVAVDTWSLAAQFRNQGIYVYSKQLLRYFREFATAYSVEIRPFTCPQSDNDANALETCVGFVPRPSRLMKYHHPWRLCGASVSAFLGGADLIFGPAGLLISLNGLIPAVTTIHDITPVIMPSLFTGTSRAMQFYLRASAQTSQAVITDSLCSKRDLVNAFHLPESKVSVVYLGYDKAVFNDDPAKPDAQQNLFARLGLNKPYIFHHGTIQPRKNLARLIQAFRLMSTNNPNLEFDLVLAGALGWMYDDVLAAANEHLPTTSRVIFAGTLSDEDVALLIKGASLAVFPSLYEGFCLPMIEAMACGIPTIASDTSCLPEVSGGVLKYFDPHSTEDMSQCMKQALEDSAIRQQLSCLGKERAESFDWRRCAQETISVLTSFRG